jgi:hypothetical protein
VSVAWALLLVVHLEPASEVVSSGEPWRPMPWRSAVSFLAAMTASVAYWFPSGHPLFRTRARPRAKVRWYYVIVGVVTTVGAGCAPIFLRATTPGTVLVANSAVIAVVLATRFAAHRAAHRPLVRLTAARRSPAFAEDVVGTWAGVVRDPTPVEVDGTPAAVAAIERYPWSLAGETSGHQLVPASRSFLARHTFLVGDAQKTIEIDPESMEWSSSVITNVAPDHEDMFTYTSIPVGGRAALWGRLAKVSDGWHLRAVGDEAPIVLAGSAQHDPAGAARRAVRQHRRALAVMTACLLVGIGLAIAGP